MTAFTQANTGGSAQETKFITAVKLYPSRTELLLPLELLDSDKKLNSGILLQLNKLGRNNSLSSLARYTINNILRLLMPQFKTSYCFATQAWNTSTHGEVTGNIKTVCIGSSYVLKSNPNLAQLTANSTF